MSNIIFKCPTCQAPSEKVFNPSLVMGFQRIIYKCGKTIDYFEINETIVKGCDPVLKGI